MRLILTEAGIEALRDADAQVEVIHPDEVVLAALITMGVQRTCFREGLRQLRDACISASGKRRDYAPRRHDGAR